MELNKAGGQTAELGLEPGVYSVVLDTKASRMEGSVRVTNRQAALVTMATLHPAPLDKATARGVDTDTAGRPPQPPKKDPGAAIGAAVGEIVGTAIGNVMDAAATAAAAAAGVANAHAPADRGAPGGSDNPYYDGGDPGDSANPPDSSPSDPSVSSQSMSGPDPGFDRRPATQVFELALLPGFLRGPVLLPYRPRHGGERAGGHARGRPTGSKSEASPTSSPGTWSVSRPRDW